MKNRVDSYLVAALPAAEALLAAKLELRQQALRNEGYGYIAERGHDLANRLDYFPSEIATPAGPPLVRLGVGYRAVVYGLGDLVLKTNFNFSYEVSREARVHARAVAQLGQSAPDWLGSLEEVLGAIQFVANEPPILAYKAGHFGRFFGAETVLVKRKIRGADVAQIVARHGADWFDREKLRTLARLFVAYARSGILLQGDPGDFCFDLDTGRWRAIDADGWMIYEPGDPYCLHANQRNFLGVFTREWGPGAANAANFTDEQRAAMDRVLSEVHDLATEEFLGLDTQPYCPGEVERALREDNLLSPADPRLRALIRYEFDDVFRLDSELAHCNLNVLLTTSQLFDELLDLRDVAGLAEVYFGDLEMNRKEKWVVIWSPYNDETVAGNHAANHSGLCNRAIAERVLETAHREGA